MTSKRDRAVITERVNRVLITTMLIGGGAELREFRDTVLAGDGFRSGIALVLGVLAIAIAWRYLRAQGPLGSEES